MLLADGYFGVVHAVCGDMAWFAERLRLRHFHPGAEQPCCFCRCDRSTVPFKDLREAAEWRSTCAQPPLGRQSTSPIWDIPGLSLFTVRLDLMHIMDLGVIPHFIGSCFWSMVYNAEVPGATISMRLRFLWNRIKFLYDAQKTNCRISRLDLSLFTDPSRPRAYFPFFKGKAAKNRHMLPIVLFLCQELNSGSARDTARVACATGLADFSNCCTRANVIMTEEESTRARKALQHGMHNYMILSYLAVTDERRPSFNVVNKHHFLMHVGLSAAHINPEAVWTYQWEDLAGRAQRIAMSSKAGTRSINIPAAFMRRYRRVLHTSLR
jgi:hypothetical protein